MTIHERESALRMDERAQHVALPDTRFSPRQAASRACDLTSLAVTSSLLLLLSGACVAQV